MSEPILKVEDAFVEFPMVGGAVRALDGVSITVNPSETVAVVGESGCGKTTLARAVLGLQPLKSGRITLLGEQVLGVLEGAAQKVGIVWQDPYASLDPRWKVGRSAVEPLRLLGKPGVAGSTLENVGLDPKYADRFPHQLSGGQRQRVAIGRALAPNPPLIICDEPTAALDLSIRAQILNLLKQVQGQTKNAILYISHDLGTVRFLADRVAVMYLGRIVEEGPTETIFGDPRHPYTRALLDSAPTLEKLLHLPDAPPGEIPDPRTRFVGCRYEGRCPNAAPICIEQDPGETSAFGRRFYCHSPMKSHSLTVKQLTVSE